MEQAGETAAPKQERIHDDISDQIVEIVARITAAEGAHKVTVKNIDEVLRIVYRNTVVNMRESIKPEFHDKASFAQFCLDTAVSVLVQSYDVKMQFRRYIFEHDSLTEENRIRWYDKIKKYYQYALEQGFAKPVDAEALCCAIWCFCRGYYADAVSRQLSREEAVRNFTFGFTCLLSSVIA